MELLRMQAKEAVTSLHHEPLDRTLICSPRKGPLEPPLEHTRSVKPSEVILPLEMTMVTQRYRDQIDAAIAAAAELRPLVLMLLEASPYVRHDAEAVGAAIDALLAARADDEVEPLHSARGRLGVLMGIAYQRSQSAVVGGAERERLLTLSWALNAVIEPTSAMMAIARNDPVGANAALTSARASRTRAQRYEEDARATSMGTGSAYVEAS